MQRTARLAVDLLHDLLADDPEFRALELSEFHAGVIAKREGGGGVFCGLGGTLHDGPISASMRSELAHNGKRRLHP
jgi:hypothetical protein